MIVVGGSSDGRLGLVSCEILENGHLDSAVDAGLADQSYAWSVVELLAHPRKRHAACLSGAEVLVLGGIDARKKSLATMEAIGATPREDEDDNKDKQADVALTASGAPPMPVGQGRFDFVAVARGLGRIVALHCRSSASYQIPSENRCLCF